MNRTAIVCTAAASVALLASAYLTAGPLNPPAGPAASTYKTLAEVEPRIAINAVNTPGDADSVYRITAPGSYYVTANLTGTSGKAGIEVAASGVTIDLMGFRLEGVPGSLDGIATSGATQNQLIVRNGTVTAWGGTGVNLVASGNGTDCTVEAVHAVDNGKHGVVAPGRSIIRHCVARGNQGGGFTLIDNGIFESCLASANGSSGIETAGMSTIRGCTIFGNASTGLAVGQGCTVEACSVMYNGANGMSVGSGSTVRGCSATGNTLGGIFAFSGCVIESCAVHQNGSNGIQLSANCHAFRNECTANGQQVSNGAGILTTGKLSRIDSNHCVGNDIGIRVTTADNIIIRNTCSTNSAGNWDVAAQNYLLVVNAVHSAAAVTANAGGANLGTNDPNANFSFQ